MTYVINMIAILRRKYKVHLVIFNKEKTHKITTNLRKLLKHKVEVLNTMPSVIFTKQEVYNMIDFYD